MVLELNDIAYQCLLKKVWYVGPSHKIKYYEIAGLTFRLTFSFLSTRWIWVVLEVKSSQNCPINAGVPQIPIFCLTVFMRYIFQGLSGNVICNMGTYADDTTFCCKCD